MTACSSSDTKQKPTQTSTKTTTQYKVATVEKGGLATTLKLPAQLAAYEEVSIFPKVNGYVKTVLVDIGSEVKKGQLLMTLEAPEMQEQTIGAKEKYLQSQSNFAISKERYQRLAVAAATAGAISPYDLSSAKSTMQADSALSNAQKTNWQMQQTVQGYLNVTAPFEGVITQRNVHPGALVNAVDKSSPMLELKTIKHLRLQVQVPENIAASLKEKDSIYFTTSAMPGVRFAGIVSRKSMNIQSQLRSELIEADIDNQDAKLSPGMYADVMLSSGGSANAFIVPKTAVLTTTEGKYILVKDEKSKFKKITVTTGNQTDSKTEVFGNVEAGEQVIANPDEAMLDDAE